MDDEDDFEYDEDFSFGESDAGEEDMEQEFVLDELRSMLISRPSDARDGLKTLAETVSSKLCIEAGSELLKLDPTRESFNVLLTALINAPDDVEDYERLTPLEEGLALMAAKLEDSAQIIGVHEVAVQELKKTPRTRLFLKALILLASAQFHLASHREAAQAIFNREIVPILTTLNTVWMQSFRFDALVLQVEIAVSTGREGVPALRKLLQEEDSIPKSSKSQLGILVVTEARARLCIISGVLYEAKPLLEECIRGYSDSVALNDKSPPVVRSAVLLILVSAILGKGNYNPISESPSTNWINHIDLNSALDAAKAFADQDAKLLKATLTALRKRFRECQWLLGLDEILDILRQAFVFLRIETSLRAYSRIRLTHLKELLGPEFKLSEADLYDFIQDDDFGHHFSVNLVDNTVDRIPPHYSSWKFEDRNKTDNKQDDKLEEVLKWPLPQHYIERDAIKKQLNKESQILRELRHVSAPDLTGSSYSTQSRRRPPLSARKRDFLSTKVHELLRQAKQGHEDIIMR